MINASNIGDLVGTSRMLLSANSSPTYANLIVTVNKLVVVWLCVWE